jgi:hypothetical protein
VRLPVGVEDYEARRRVCRIPDLRSCFYEEGLLAFSKADLNEIEEVSAKKIASDATRAETYDKREGAKLWVAQFDTVESSLNHGTGGRFKRPSVSIQ